MATILDTFVTKFKFKSDRNELKTIGNNLGNLKSQILKIGVAIAAVVGGGAFVGKISETVDQMGKFATSVGLSVKQLQELQFIAKRTGVPIGSLQSSIVNLNKVIGEAARGYGIYGQVLARFGVSIRNNNGTLLNTFQLFTQLNRTFQHLSHAQQFDLAQNIGLNPQTVQMLQQTPKVFDQLIKKSKQLGEFTQKDFEKSAKFQDALTDMRTSFFELGVQIASFTLPVLTKVANFFTYSIEFIKNNLGIFKALAVAVSIIAAEFVILKMNALKGWIATFAPLIAGIAALTAITLIIQDIINGLDGGQSIILKWIMHFKFMRSLVAYIKNQMQGWLNLMHAIENVFSKIKSKFSGLPDVESKVNNIFHSHSNIIPSTTAASTSNTSHASHVEVGGITINAPSGNPTDISHAVTDALRNHFKDSINDFDSGIAR